MERKQRGLYLVGYQTKRLPPISVDEVVIPDLGLGMNERTITSENIGNTAKRLSDSIKDAHPDYIIACDRGARLIALATHIMYQKLYGSLPTIDHRINFRKISRKDDLELLKKIISSDVTVMLEEVVNPHLMIIDDWSASGRTRAMIDSVISELSHGKITVQHELMWEDKAPVNISSTSFMYCDWYERYDLIGIDYNPYTLIPIKIESPAAIAYRREMSRTIKAYIKKSHTE